MDIKEFEIPVPWGHIAVKAWGNEENTPVLTIHGVSDNAGSFDRLIPYLPTSFYYLCIDLPSHGRSSQYPPYLLISALNNIIAVKLVVDYLARKNYIFMGHSWGGQTALFFTQLYPEYTLKLIIFDIFHFIPIRLHKFKNFLKGRIDTLLKINENIGENQKPPLYTYEEAVSKLIQSRTRGELFRESAEALLKRSLVPAQGGKFILVEDPRLKAFVNPVYEVDYIEGFVKLHPITCPVLFIIASDCKAIKNYSKEIVEEYERQNKNCIIRMVKGSHDVHNNSPEIVGPIVSRFLKEAKSKL